MITNNILCSKKLLGGSENMMPKALQQRLTMDAMADLTPGGENLPKIDSYAYDNGKQPDKENIYQNYNTLSG